LDRILASQILVAWAGESGDPEDPDAQRLGWWRADLTNEFGGRSYFEDLAPRTAAWASVQAVREAARRHDAAQRAKTSSSDQLLTLFHLGFVIDERLETRFQDLKRSGRSPSEALPLLSEHLSEEDWSAPQFADWLAKHSTPGIDVDPNGRRVRGTPPSDPGEAALKLLAALAPLSDAYPMPYFKRARG
jgi:hypothetical protein